MPRALFGAVAALTILSGALVPPPAGSQELQDQVRPLVGENAELYAGPVSEGLGWSMGQPVADDAGSLRPLRFEVSARVLAALPPDGATSFDPVLPAEVTYRGRTFTEPYVLADGAEGSPTVVGQGRGARLEPAGGFRDRLAQEGRDPDDFAFRLPDGLNLPALPFPLIQGSVGVGLGTQVTGRYTPPVRLGDELGSIGSRGFAAQHELTHWFPGVARPFAVAVEGGHIRFDVGDVLDGSTSHVGLAVSGTAGILTVFGQAGMQRSTVDVRYTAEGPVFEERGAGDLPRFPGEGEEVSFTSTVDSSPRFSAGALFRFFVFRLSTHFTLADFNGASVKLGVGPP